MKRFLIGLLIESGFNFLIGQMIKFMISKIQNSGADYRMLGLAHF